MPFINERLELCPRYGSGVSENYSVQEIKTSGGNRYKALLHPYPEFSIDIDFNNRTETELIDQVVDLFHRCGGNYSAFRLKNLLDFTTNDYKETPTFNDQKAELVSEGIYQATRWYGDESVSTSTRRRLYKLVSGTDLWGIRDDSSNPVQLTNGYTADVNTGKITFDANKTYSITNISQAANAVVTIGTHTLAEDDTVHFSAVAGMTEINGLRGTVLSVGASTITVDINTTGFTAYSSAGTVNTRPQENEVVTFGGEFDIPVQFSSASLPSLQYVARNKNDLIMGITITLEEVLNPA